MDQNIYDLQFEYYLEQKYKLYDIEELDCFDSCYYDAFLRKTYNDEYNENIKKRYIYLFRNFKNFMLRETHIQAAIIQYHFLKFLKNKYKRN